MKVQFRSDGTAEISGYVNVTERQSRLLHDNGGHAFYETVKSGTFASAIAKNPNVGLQFNHQRDLCGLHELYEDSVGLFARAVIDDEEVVKEARAGNLTGWSFGFYIREQEIEGGDPEKRKLTDIDLIEVSILNVTPAYIATSVQVRSDEEAKVHVRMGTADTVEIVGEMPPLNVETYRRKLELLKMKGALK